MRASFMTYEQLHGLVELVARQLVTVGVRPCIRVVIHALAARGDCRVPGDC